MANREHLARLLDSKQAWNEWRKSTPGIRPDLRQANLIFTDLRGVDFSVSDLSRADLNGSDLGAACLRAADLSEADLSGANLTMADLNEANLSRADLRTANLSATNITLANFSGAIMLGTILVNIDLRNVRGLEAVRHDGPSSIGTDTIYRSGGNIAEKFLRGVGVGNDLISSIKNLAGGIQFYSCFISYSSKDQAFAEQIYSDLQGNGVRCWFAPHDIQAGKKLHEQIDEAIRVHQKLLLVLSPHSIKSEWVKTEIANARRREIIESKKVLFPIRLIRFDELQKWECFDADIGKDSAREIREYYIPDFSSWKDPASYQREFARLLKDLTSEKANNAKMQD